jgi:DNA replication protein DnaC
LLNHLERQTLIILDDFGLQALTQEIRLTLLQLLEDRYGKKSIIITSQLPLSKWYEYINDPTLADAIMDRLTANAVRVELKGESLRRKKSK